MTPQRIGKRRLVNKRRRSKKRNSRVWIMPLGLILTVFAFYALDPSETNIAHQFIFPSYKLHDDPETGYPLGQVEYGKGRKDMAFVSFYILVLFFLRNFLIRVVFKRLGRYLGITSARVRCLFNEQMYLVLYTGLVGPVGLYIMYHSPTWYFNTRGMYEAYPHKTHLATTKAYYLLQAAFWAQQALVMALGLETRRRDFKELVAHHVITVALIGLSYRFHFTAMGVLIYVTHDISDFFLATSKALNYIDSPLQAPVYALCIISWVYLRHFVNLDILISVLTEFGTVGPYTLDWTAGQYKCVHSQIITLALLAGLQALNLFWLGCLVRVAHRFVVLGVAKDDREEEEEEEEEEDDEMMVMVMVQEKGIHI
ncbi:TLC domain-containing protein [Poronia punctata]|nr:TLC domain-containing protein [Poronia punctata]